MWTYHISKVFNNLSKAHFLTRGSALPLDGATSGPDGGSRGRSAQRRLDGRGPGDEYNGGGHRRSMVTASVGAGKELAGDASMRWSTSWILCVVEVRFVSVLFVLVFHFLFSLANPSYFSLLAGLGCCCGFLHILSAYAFWFVSFFQLIFPCLHLPCLMKCLPAAMSSCRMFCTCIQHSCSSVRILLSSVTLLVRFISSPLMFLCTRAYRFFRGFFLAELLEWCYWQSMVVLIGCHVNDS